MEDSFSVDRLREPKYEHNGQAISEAEYKELLSSIQEKMELDWRPVSDFAPVIVN